MPVLLQVADRAVYSAHDYPSSIYQQTWFNAQDYPENLPEVWDSFWGYIPKKGLRALALMGEFGTRLETDSDRQWLKALVAHLGIGTDGIHWTFWSWNPNSEDTYGLLLLTTGLPAPDQRNSNAQTYSARRPPNVNPKSAGSFSSHSCRAGG